MPSSCPSVAELREKAAAKLAERKRAKNMPSRKVNVILDKQRENLRKTINECAKEEERRATKMERATSRDQRESLDVRFEKERETDRQRIQIIQDDLNKLKHNVIGKDLPFIEPLESNIVVNVDKIDAIEACKQVLKKYNEPNNK